MKQHEMLFDRFIGNTDLCLRIQDIYLKSNIGWNEIFEHLSIPCFAWSDGLHTTCFESSESTLLTARDYQNNKLVWTVIWEREDNKIKWSLSTEYETVQAQAVDIGTGAFQHYMGVQILSTYRPEVFTISEKQVIVPKTIKKDGRFKEVRTTKMIRVIQLNSEELAKRHNIITCPCWGVAGHYRHYKNGKTVFIKSYRKGKHRDDPEAYQPKTYET